MVKGKLNEKKKLTYGVPRKIHFRHMNEMLKNPGSLGRFHWVVHLKML